ncbi:LysE/ArgO family amino acid transporter [Allorhizobium undicola]|uniref:LysE/ArgO family amino acid transporter n=1 Tax=Allorhizobium undicola TaxID=78527 RepID=UPI001AEBB87F|nr:LysE/ArgO family amino acid transporter [Allorhizobium undicola]
MMHAFFPGFFLGMSLIAAIGAQNAFVLRQGLQRQHVFAVCLTCAASDTILVTVGVAGFGFLVTAVPWLETVMTLGGAVFLALYAVKSFWAALSDSSSLRPSEMKIASLPGTIAAALAFTWLNPHVYLDTVVLLGSISTNYGDDRFLFAVGAITASFVFFFSLGWGARLLTPMFSSPRSWRILEFVIGLVMSALAVKLVIAVCFYCIIP